ncbi:hypothetical protein KDX38_23250 [Pseudomonas sp. CDFA 602]|uniref:hypothetical protein n=1 Tax=Pseudomonas californiensis TaxID=2829823 RepID=UPI001E656EC4|nr:hypothetical protein [Pseudomonas californiensis]MCD5996510.1 hypothetical protein [Pseudomonas californiensis]MCD6002109.1 hypothetical protein [Pseudomonas californiensis]
MIIVLLLVIIFILAPWLIGVVAALAAVYGVFIVTVGVVALAVAILFVPVYHLLNRPKDYGSELRKKNIEFNKRCLQEAQDARAAEQLKASQKEQAREALAAVERPQDPDVRASDPSLLLCLKCGEYMKVGSIVCPSCGKTPPPI